MTRHDPVELVRGRLVTVMGLGRFGGGLGVVRWLAQNDADVIVTDLASESALASSVDQIRDLVESGQVELRLGGHNVSDFTTCDLVIANPAVPKPWENRYLRAAAAAGIPVTTEIQILIDLLPDRPIAVTGTAGKSTTTALIAHILSECGRRTHLGGNIGGSLLDVCHQIGPDDHVVLELSSAQLHWLEGFAPRVAVVTNFAPNHLDWHGDIGHYRASKQKILDLQQPGDVAVLASGDANFTPRNGVRVIRPAAPDPARAASLRLIGAHNARNAAAAVAACVAVGLGEDEAWRAASTFAGLPHRLEVVGEHGGVRFINDSKCTTPEAAITAIEAVGAVVPLDRIHLIAGGYDKQIDLASVASRAWQLGGLYAIGATASALASAGGGRKCGTLEAAFAEAVARAKPGDIILLSPACASWDQFTNFEERGDRFRELVRRHVEGS